MRRTKRAVRYVGMLVSIVALTASISLRRSEASAAPTLDAHVCASTDATGVCKQGEAHFCAADGSFVACRCPPGAAAASASSSMAKGLSKRATRGPIPLACVVDVAASVPAACVVPAQHLDDAIAARLEVGTLEVPSLGTLAAMSAEATVETLDKQLPTLDADHLLQLATALESIEGAVAFEASTAVGPRKGSLVVRRDDSVARVIEVRRSFVDRFPGDARLQAVRIDLARSHMRRAVYFGAAGQALDDRVAAQTILTEVLAATQSSMPSAMSSAARDARFMVGEIYERQHDAALVLQMDQEVVALTTAGPRADDPAYLAAAHVRLAEARFALGDLAAGRSELASAIEAGDLCAPRGECVQAATTARQVMPMVWAALGAPARTMVSLLVHPSLTSIERTQPLTVLATIDAAVATPACSAAAQEARAWGDALR